MSEITAEILLYVDVTQSPAEYWCVVKTHTGGSPLCLPSEWSCLVTEPNADGLVSYAVNIYEDATGTSDVQHSFDIDFSSFSEVAVQVVLGGNTVATGTVKTIAAQQETR